MRGLGFVKLGLRVEGLEVGTGDEGLGFQF